jgi:antitoxin MazE
MKMNLDLIDIGNSKGIRLPKPVIEACGIEKTMQLVIEDGKIIITPIKALRAGWNDAFKKPKTDKLDSVITEFSEISNDFDQNDWTW